MTITTPQVGVSGSSYSSSTSNSLSGALRARRPLNVQAVLSFRNMDRCIIVRVCGFVARRGFIDADIAK